MHDEEIKSLAKVRIERADELITDAEKLLKNASFLSANNRAFYAGEKALKAVLALKGKDSATHNGVIKTFNSEFIHNPSEYFDRDDFRRIQSLDRIRTASDYDDFYIASKEDCERQVEEAKLLIKKVKEYLLSQGVMVSTQSD